MTPSDTAEAAEDSTVEDSTAEDANADIDYTRQEIRVAAVLNGGVSLAVWMSGVVIELHHLGMSSLGLGSWPATYREVLDVLRADARVDVVAGTSAGGLNGTFLALGTARRRDFSTLRDVWVEDASMARLLRPAHAPNPPSAMQGDDYFLPRIKEALQNLAEAAELTAAATNNAGNTAPDTATAATGQPIELILTGTLWSGRDSRFTDEMGVGIIEKDYNATFRFTNQSTAGTQAGTQAGTDAGYLGDIATNPRPKGAVIDQLAEAARCTSSFPAAFEPHYVTSGTAQGSAPGSWSSSAGEANFDTSQYVIDGGVLLNKPIRPALDAIYRQTADKQVRRVLAYVVPDPGEPVPTPETQVQGPIPGAADVLLGIMTRLRSTDSVSRELAEIRDNNAVVRERQNARSRLCAALTSVDPTPGTASPLALALWDGYCTERLDSACISIGKYIAAGQPPGTDAWSAKEITDALFRIRTKHRNEFRFVPMGELSAALQATGERWSWGQTTVVRVGDIAMDVLRRALAVALDKDNPDDGAAAPDLAKTRKRLGIVLARIGISNSDLIRFWMDVARRGDFPKRETLRTAQVDGQSRHAVAVDVDAAVSATNVRRLDEKLEPCLTEWDQLPGTAAGAPNDLGAARHKLQYEAAKRVVTILFDVKDQLDTLCRNPPPALPEDQVATPEQDNVTQLHHLHRWLFLNTADADELLRRMLQLDVVHLATAGGLAAVEQLVELVQVSAASRDRVTGMQLDHFGAFYRGSWRVNDWVEGRLDGARQILRFLLSPERLRQVGFSSADPQQLLDVLEPIAVTPNTGNTAFLQTLWDRNADFYLDEVRAALDPDSGNTALDLLSEAVAAPLWLDSLKQDLPALAASIRAEGTDAPNDSQIWLREFDRQAVPGHEDQLSAEQIWDLRELMRDRVGTQKIENDYGSDTFARTVSHAAVVATGAFTAPLATFGRFKPITLVLSSLRGYVAMVYVMVSFLTRGSAIGARLVEVAVATGGVLIAVSVLVPNVPAVLTAVGILLILAAASTSALRTRHAFWMGVRLALAALLVLAVVVYPLVRHLREHGYDGAAQSLVQKIVVGAGIVLVGWFVVWTSVGELHGRAVRIRGVTLMLGAVAWTVGILIADTRHAGVWNGTAISFSACLAGFVLLLGHARRANPAPLRSFLVSFALLAALGAVASSIVELAGVQVSWLVRLLECLLPVALLLSAAALIWYAAVGAWTGLARWFGLVTAAAALVLAGWLVPFGWNLNLSTGVQCACVLVGFAGLGLVLLARPEGVLARAPVA